jgi:hypothetical protein
VEFPCTESSESQEGPTPGMQSQMYLTGGSDGFRNTCLQEGWSFFVHLDHLLGREVKMGVGVGVGHL